MAPADLVTASRASSFVPERQGSVSAGLAAYRQPEQQLRLGNLQQGLAYAAQLDTALQQMKSELTRALVGSQDANESALQSRRGSVQQLWQQRSVASAGQLDGQLNGVSEGEVARQHFRIRGLDVAALSLTGSETLRLALPGHPRPLSMQFDGQGLQAHLRSLQRALAPTPLRLEAQDGELGFSVPEAQWPTVRDGLSLRGDGKRFPSGQMVRAVLEAQAQALTPQTWQLDTIEGQRLALAQLLKAQQQLRSSQSTLALDLASASEVAVEGRTPEATAQIEQFASGFAAIAERSALDYRQLSELVPAVIGLRRSQVQQLLSAAGSMRGEPG